MPLFEYKCLKCDHQFEQIVSTTLPVKIICPKCESENIEKLLSAPGGIISKGNATCPSARSCSEVGSCCSRGKCPHG